ncbi:MAG: alpha/beta fold hydrolase, partial [Thioalkalivibrio sp.]|nr:alpha/beta fold hydrolase [Thioalkalivibrio sp.]
MPSRDRVIGAVLAGVFVVFLAACGGSAPGDGAGRDVVQLSDEETVFVAPTGEQVTFPAVQGELDAEVEVAVAATGSQGMPVEAQLLTRAVTLTFRNLAELPDGSTVSFDLPNLDAAVAGAQSLSSNVYVIVSGRERSTAINERDWEYFGNFETVNDRSVLTVTKAGLDAIALSLDESGPSLDGKPMGFQVATNTPDLFKPAAKGLYRVNLNSGSVPSIQEAALDPIEYCHQYHSSLFSRLPTPASPTGQERRVAVLLVHGYQSVGVPLGDNLSKYAHCNVWLNTIAAFEHRAGDWQTLRSQTDLYAVRYDTDDRIMLSGSEVRYYLHQLSQQLGYEEIVILAHSMGGVVSVAARQQASYPEEVNGIVTLGTPHMGAPMRCSVAENGICLGWKYGPGSLGDLSWLLTSGVSLVSPSDGGLDLTLAYPSQLANTVANPYLVNLWSESRNATNVHAIYGSNEFSTFSTGLTGVVGKTLFGFDVGYNDMFIPASSAAGSRVLNEDGRPYASMFARVTGVGRDHEQLHAGCNSCSDGRTSQDRYDPYFDEIVEALLAFVPSVGISVAPTTVTLAPNATQAFTATVSGAATTSVTWSATCGGIAGTGNTITYTAPSSAGSCSLTARSVADASRSASATVTVTDGVPIAGADLVVRGLSVTPSSAVAGANITV